ncbi:MAG: Bug family tripartite tricarboxylate transporter substrate binding protein [Paracraurococcus sp.]
MQRRAILAAPALLFAPAARAQAWPSRPVTLLVASPAGGGTDFAARLVAEPLGQRLGQSVIVENRPGGNGAIGMLAAIRARPDGHTLIVAYSGTLTGKPAVEGVADYDPGKDLLPIAQITNSPQVMMVHPSVPARTLTEFVAYAKTRPGQLNYGSSGNGSLHHLGCELLKLRTGIDIVHVPYRGTGETITDLLAGRLHFYMNSPPPVLGFFKDGRLRPIATTGEERHRALPEVPTLIEQGFEPIPIDSWFPLLAPVGAPAPILARLAAELRGVLADPGVQRRAEEAGTFAAFADAGFVATRMARETAAWTTVVKQAGIRPD